MQLALETSTNICSVALRARDGEVHEKRTEVRGSHSEKLFLFINELLKEQGVNFDELKSIVVSEGPGSYTGLRISASAVKGLLFDSEKKLFTANTLAGFAESVIDADENAVKIHSIIDARRVHVYHQTFEHESGILRSADSVRVIPIKQLEKMLKKGDAVIGTGLQRIDQNLLEGLKVYNHSHITARSLLSLLQRDTDRSFVTETDPRKFEPRYYTSKQV